eukprot:400726-Amphidinium_carterae.2
MNWQGKQSMAWVHTLEQKWRVTTFFLKMLQATIEEATTLELSWTFPKRFCSGGRPRQIVRNSNIKLSECRTHPSSLSICLLNTLITGYISCQS